jgi:hypothetical protein
MTEGRMILLVPGGAEVGRVSPRPQDRGRSCTFVRPRTVARGESIGPTGAMVAVDPAVSERRALPYAGRQAAFVSGVIPGRIPLILDDPF